MKTKICYKCKTRKSVSRFYPYRRGVNKGRYSSFCKKCESIRRRQYPPWVKIYFKLKARCRYARYYKDYNIKNLLTIKELEHLWFRDKGYSLERPNIHRINSKGDYTLQNTCFIEEDNHKELHKKRFFSKETRERMSKAKRLYWLNQRKGGSDG